MIGTSLIVIGTQKRVETPSDRNAKPSKLVSFTVFK
jgi:hypothetical protein